MAAVKVAAATVLVLCASLGARASISGNPDSWELPPAAPNYYYHTQGLVGDGALSTLVTIRDPLVADTAYNTSLFAFSVSGGLVPLNYIQLTDGHCQSTMVADLLICDFQSSGPGNSIIYQLAVHAGAGGANRLVIVDQTTVPVTGALANRPAPLYIPATGHVVALQYATDDSFTVYDITRNTSDSQGLSAVALGTVAVTHPYSMYVSADGTQLTINTDSGLLTFSYPGLQLLRTTDLGDGAQYILGVSGAATEDFGFTIGSTSAAAGVFYQPVDFSDGTTVGSQFPDPTTTFYSSGLYTATSGTPFSGTVGPCVYVQGMAATQGKGRYGLISQVRVPTNAGAAFSIEAQLPVDGVVANTMVANSGYLFIVEDEIMYRYIASC